MTFVFTKTPPSKEGYYWVRHNQHVWITKVCYGEYFPLELIEAYIELKDKEEKIAFQLPVGFFVPGGDSFEDYSVETVDYEWAGPIPEPEESL